MRKALLLAAILLCLCLPVWSEAQSCDGCGIGYRPSSLGSSGGTLTGPLLLSDGTVTAPGIAFASEPTTGFYRIAAGFWGLTLSGAGRIGFYPAIPEIRLNSAGALVWVSNNNVGTGTADLYLYRDAANTLALRNGTAAQTFHAYATYSDASNYARGTLAMNAANGELTVSTNQAGTGPVGGLKLLSASGIIYSIGALYPSSTDTYSLGSGSSAWTMLPVTRSIQGSKTFALTDNVAAAFVRIAVPQTVDANFAGGDVIWTATAKDATPHIQSLSGRLTFTAVNNAGTEACTVSPTAAVAAPLASSSGTLTCTFTCASAAADTVDLSAQCDTSFGTPTGVAIRYRLDMPQPNTVTPQ